MEFPDIEVTSFVDTLDIADKCAHCPAIRGLLEEIGSLEEQKGFLNSVAEQSMGGLPEEVKAQLITHIEQDHIEAIQGMSPEAIVADMELQHRQGVTSHLDSTDEKIDRTKALVTEKLDNCDGRLTLRGIRNSAEYLVTICGSRTFTQRENPSPAIVKIRNHRPNKEETDQ